MPTLQEYLANTNIERILKLFKLPFHTILVYSKGNSLFKEYNQKTVTIYGSARIKQNTKWYDATADLATAIAKQNIAIMTGGGPGIMEAANYGAKRANAGKSLGCCIKTHLEQSGNEFLDISLTSDYFFIRKVLLTKFSKAFIVAPGGYGTLDELFEILNLIITKKMKQCPVILFGKEYWEPLINFMQKSLVANGTISQNELNSIIVTDDIGQVCEIIT